MRQRTGWICFIGLLVALTFIIPVTTSASWYTPTPSEPTRGPVAERWQALFAFDPSLTYTYQLQAYRRGRLNTEGELNLAVSGSTVRLWYTVGKFTGQATSSRDPQAIVGSLFLSALTAQQPAGDTELRLITAPFQFVQWYDLFAQGNYASSVVWQEFSQPAASFRIDNTSWIFDYSPNWRRSEVYEGSVRRGRDTLMTLEIVLDRPLPLRVSVIEGDWEYVAELVITQPSRPVLR